MNTSVPIKEFRLASTSASAVTRSLVFSDIDGLALDFDEDDRGKFLATLNIHGTSNDFAGKGAIFRLVLRDGGGESSVLDQGFYTSAAGGQIVTLSLVCEAAIVPAAGGSQIVAQWAAFNNFTDDDPGTARIYEGGLSTLSAVGSLQPKKEPFDDENHFEYPELFSRGLRLTDFSEVLFITGYSASPASDLPSHMFALTPPKMSELNLTPSRQMQWIVDHLDQYFATIPYKDGTGHYSKSDIVYFDLVIDRKVSDEQQEAVLKVLETWFGPVAPKPSTGILKKVEALAFPTIQVEIEFILAH